MKKILLFWLLLLCPWLASGASTWNLSVTFINEGSAVYGGSQPGACNSSPVQVRDTEIDLGSGGVLNNSWSSQDGLTHPVTNGQPLVMTWNGFHANGYGAIGYGCQLYFLYGTNVYFVAESTNNWTEQGMAASLTIMVNGDNCECGTNTTLSQPAPALGVAVRTYDGTASNLTVLGGTVKGTLHMLDASDLEFGQQSMENAGYTGIRGNSANDSLFIRAFTKVQWISTRANTNGVPIMTLDSASGNLYVAGSVRATNGLYGPGAGITFSSAQAGTLVSNLGVNASGQTVLGPSTASSNNFMGKINQGQIDPPLSSAGVNSNSFTGQLNYGQLYGVPGFLTSVYSNDISGQLNYGQIDGVPAFLTEADSNNFAGKINQGQIDPPLSDMTDSTKIPITNGTAYGLTVNGTLQMVNASDLEFGQQGMDSAGYTGIRGNSANDSLFIRAFTKVQWLSTRANTNGVPIMNLDSASGNLYVAGSVRATNGLYGPGAGITFSNAQAGTLVSNLGVNASGQTVLGPPAGAAASATFPANSFIFNVRDYGALGNGTNDDWVAIMATLQACSTNGGSVLLPPGDYILTNALSVDMGGKGIRIYGSTPQTSVLWCSNSTMNGLVVTSIVPCIYEDFGIRTKVTKTAGAGIVLDSATTNWLQPRSTVRNVFIESPFIGIQLKKAEAWNITGVQITAAACYGIDITPLPYNDHGDSTVNNSFILGNQTPSSTTNVGIYIHGSTGIRINNNKINNFAYGVWGNCFSPQATIIIINDNSIENAYANNIKFSSGNVTNSFKEIVISGNQLFNAANSYQTAMIESDGTNAAGLVMIGNHGEMNAGCTNCLFCNIVDCTGVLCVGNQANTRLASHNSWPMWAFAGHTEGTASGNVIDPVNFGFRFENTATNMTTIDVWTGPYTTSDHCIGDQIINNFPYQLGSGGSMYTIIGWQCSVAGNPGTWFQRRCLTGN